jgi:hypothetical protein
MKMNNNNNHIHQMKKKITCLFFACACLLAANKITAQSGVSGDCTWTVTGPFSDRILIISPGSSGGAMENYASSSSTPWYNYRATMKTLVIEDGVTHIGNYAFWGFTGYTDVLTIPNSVTTIGNYAFYQCSSAGALTLPNSVTTIGTYAFTDAPASAAP